MELQQLCCISCEISGCGKHCITDRSMTFLEAAAPAASEQGKGGCCGFWFPGIRAVSSGFISSVVL